jgi:hypothetical protein
MIRSHPLCAQEQFILAAKIGKIHMVGKVFDMIAPNVVVLSFHIVSIFETNLQFLWSRKVKPTNCMIIDPSLAHWTNNQ